MWGQFQVKPLQESKHADLLAWLSKARAATKLGLQHPCNWKLNNSRLPKNPCYPLLTLLSLEKYDIITAKPVVLIKS